MSRLRALLAAFCVVLACRSAAPVAPPKLFPGQTVWRLALPEPIQGPLVQDPKRVFVATRDGGVRAVDKASGQLVWGSQGRGGFLTRRGADGLVVRSATGTVWMLDPRTGTPRWSAETGVQGELPAVASGNLLFVSGSALVALDAATGHESWRAQEPGPFTSEPFATGDLVIVGETGGHLRARDAATGAIRWTYDMQGDPIAPPILDDRGHFLVGTTDRRFVALDKEGKLDWRWRLGSHVRLPATVFERTVLFASHEAVLYALSRSGGNLAWRASLPSRPLSGPQVLRGAVVVACAEDELVSFDARTGGKLARLKMPYEVAGAPLVDDELIYVPLREPSVIALRPASEAAVPSPSPGSEEDGAEDDEEGVDEEPAPSPAPSPSPSAP